VKTAFALLAAAIVNPSQVLDPSRAHTIVVATPGVAERSTPLLLPEQPSVTWRVRVAGGIVHPPAVATDGSILVAHAQPTLARYDANGRLLWTARLGASPAATTPIALAGGTSLVLTEAAEVIGLSARGSLLYARQLPLGSMDHRPVIGAMRDASLLIADGRRLIRLGGTGEVTHATLLDEEAAALLGAPGRPLVVSIGGTVSELLPDGRLGRRWELGGKVSAAVRVDAARLWAVVDARKLVELDCIRGALRVVFEDPAIALAPNLAVNHAGEARVLARGGLLLALQADGRERFRAQLPPSYGSTGAADRSDFALDRAGTAVLVHSGADAVSVLPDGSVVRIDATACAEPLRPVALQGRGAVLACRSGVLARIDQRR
jgi:hypothetical protein